jgi:hypothetical protein
VRTVQDRGSRALQVAILLDNDAHDSRLSSSISLFFFKYSRIFPLTKREHIHRVDILSKKLLFFVHGRKRALLTNQLSLDRTINVFVHSLELGQVPEYKRTQIYP